MRTAMIILCCARCGRSVKVFGKVSRVLCACGQLLFETRPVSRFPQTARRREKEK